MSLQVKYRFWMKSFCRKFPRSKWHSHCGMGWKKLQQNMIHMQISGWLHPTKSRMLSQLYTLSDAMPSSKDLSERPYVSRKSHITTKKCTHTKMSETFFVCFPYKIAWNWIFLYLVWVEMARNCKETVISNVLFHFQMACLFRIFPCDMTFNFWFFVHCFACHRMSFSFSRYLDRIVLLKGELSTEMFVISPYCDNYDNEIEKQFRMKANEKSGEELYFMCDSAFVMQMLLLQLWMRVWWWRRRRWCCCLLSLISDDFLLWIWLVWPDLLNDALYAHDAYIIQHNEKLFMHKIWAISLGGISLTRIRSPILPPYHSIIYFWGKNIFNMA